MEKLFFSADFRADINWKGKIELRAGSVRPINRKQISDGIRDMGPETIRNRFLASKRDFTEKELEYLTTLDGWNHYALGIEERERPNRGVAVARIVRSSLNESEAETAITIIDEYQHIGLGTFLLNCMILSAFERKIDTLSFTFLPQNEAIVKLIKKAGTPIHGPHNQDFVQLFLDLKKIDVERIKAQLRPTLPVIDTFHLET
jgi:GNAT superfamily N-acetyltransferase